MSAHGPDFDELVGHDVEPVERQRLLRVHEALVAAGPPAELSQGAVAPFTSDPAHLQPRRRRGALLALAAALGVLVFAVGFLAGDGRIEPGTFDVVEMSGTAEAVGASASLVLFDVDVAGNWPMEVRVSGLPPAAGGRPFEVWLTRDGEPVALCGSFLVEPDGTAVVPMNAPYKLKEFDGWVVVEEGSTTPVLTT
jgi:hypothetical protein